jgi:hypothetical protein
MSGIHSGWQIPRLLRGPLWLIPVLVLLGGASSVVPAVQAPVPNQITPNQQNPFGEYAESGPLDAQKRVSRLNADRHKTLVTDTNKLLKLAEELDAEVAANQSDALTPDELHKIAAIEKLARSVREKMAISFGGEPQFRDPGFPGGLPGTRPVGPR